MTPLWPFLLMAASVFCIETYSWQCFPNWDLNWELPSEVEVKLPKGKFAGRAPRPALLCSPDFCSLGYASKNGLGETESQHILWQSQFTKTFKNAAGCKPPTLVLNAWLTDDTAGILLGIQAIDISHPRNSAVHHLTQQLLQKYCKAVRPVHDWTKATTVYLDVCFHAVLDVDSQNQKLKTSVWYREVWNDEFLSWNPSLFDDIREVSLPRSAIWAPDIIISEFVDSERSPDLPYVYVNSSGTIKNSMPIHVVSACSLETYAFPFDIQNCSLTFSSILHTVEDVDLAFLRSEEDIKHDKKAFFNDSEWELLSVSSAYNIAHRGTGNFAQIQFNVLIRRRPLVYVVNLLIPSIFLMLVDLGSFYLPPTCRARIVFKTNVLVGYTVFRVNMADEMPRSTVSTPLIGVFFTVCMALLVFSLSKSILLVKYLHDVRCSGKELPLLCFQRNIDTDWPGMAPEAQLAGVTDSPIGPEHQAPSGTLNEIRSQLQPISNYFRTWDREHQQEVGWLALLDRLDRLLFYSYLVVLGLYSVTLCSLWALWRGS